MHGAGCSGGIGSKRSGADQGRIGALHILGIFWYDTVMKALSREPVRITRADLLKRLELLQDEIDLLRALVIKLQRHPKIPLEEALQKLGISTPKAKRSAR